jgi:hypothetical protein
MSIVVLCFIVGFGLLLTGCAGLVMRREGEGPAQAEPGASRDLATVATRRPGLLALAGLAVWVVAALAWFLLVR